MKQYKVYFQEGNKLKNCLVSEDELESFCLGKTIISTKQQNSTFTLNSWVSKKELASLFNQLAIILNANISFLDAIEIVKKSINNNSLRRLLLDMEVTLKNGKPMESAFKNHSYLDSIIIAFFTIATAKGNITQMVQALHKVLQLQIENRSLIMSKLRYPIIVMVTFTIALGIIFVYVIPKFEFIFLQYKMQLPFYTILLLDMKNFMMNYALWMILSFLIFFSFSLYFYRRNEDFEYRVDKIITLYIPVFSKLYCTFKLYGFFIAFNILMHSKYQFSEALENAKLLLKNKYLLDKIQTINESIKNGQSIYDAFNTTKLFDEVVLNLIYTGEKSSSLALCIDKIETIYEHRFKERIKHISTLIEPLFLVTMMLLILWVMLAIFTPIWNMSAMINY